MTQPDRPRHSDPSNQDRPDQEDPDVTQTVQRDQPGEQGGDEASVTAESATSDAESAEPAGEPSPYAAENNQPAQAWGVAPGSPQGGGAPDSTSSPSEGFSSPSEAASSPSAAASSPSYPADSGDPHPWQPDDAGPTTAMPPYGGPGAQSPAYGGAPTQYLPTDSPAGPPPGDYSYQQTAMYPPAGGPGGYGTGPGPAAPQVIAPPPASVVLPPVRMPKAESRVALNILGSIVGLILVAGGLVLVLLFQGKMRSVGNAAAGSPADNGVAALSSGGLDVLAIVLTVVGAILIALAALLAAWASWSPIVPGVLLAAASVWAMVTTGPGSGGVRIADGTSWAFDNDQFALFCMSGWGLGVGLVLFLCGLAAVFLRAGVRRTIRQQLESIQS